MTGRNSEMVFRRFLKLLTVGTDVTVVGRIATDKSNGGIKSTTVDLAKSSLRNDQLPTERSVETHDGSLRQRSTGGLLTSTPGATECRQRITTTVHMGVNRGGTSAPRIWSAGALMQIVPPDFHQKTQCLTKNSIFFLGRGIARSPDLSPVDPPLAPNKASWICPFASPRIPVTSTIIIIQHLYSALKSCKGYRGAGGFRLGLSEQVCFEVFLKVCTI